MRDKPEVLLASVLFRWFNRIETGEAIFKQLSLDSATAWDRVCESHRIDALKPAILGYCGKGPYVTGAYIIKTRDAMDKLSGVLWAVGQFMTSQLTTIHGEGISGWRLTATELLEWRHDKPFSLEQCWKWLRQFPYLGDFMAYEIVTDLAHTDLLCNAPDIMTWANPGPGAMRGLNRIFERDLNKNIGKENFIKEMRVLLTMSRVHNNWSPDWQPWDMRTVEHTLCEFDKYERVRLGQGAPRQRFK